MTDQKLYVRSRQPLYVQAAGQLRLKIERGVWRPGAQLPVIEELQTEFDLSRATIREALEMLEQEGLIERFRGRGTFVRAALPVRQSHNLPTSWDGLIASLRNITPKMMAPPAIKDGATLQNLLAGTAEGNFVWFQRVHTREDAPYCLIDIHLREDVYKTDIERFMSVPIILVLAERHAQLINTTFQRIMFSNADEVSARALGIALGAPVVEILRTLVDRDDKVIGHTYARYPGEYVRIDFAFAPQEQPGRTSGRNECKGLQSSGGDCCPSSLP